MRIKIYQIDQEKDTNKIKFSGIDSLKKLQGNADIDSSIYKNVFYGDVDCEDLEDIYTLFNTERVPTHQGHSLSVSDVIEVIDSDNEMYKGKCFFCDSIGYKTIDFDTSKCAQMDGLKCVYITPHNSPIELNLEINDYAVLRNAVEGHIERHFPFTDSVCIIDNENAKLERKDGNRRIGESIIAGSFLIVGYNSDDSYIALTQKQADRYMNMFAQPEKISQEEVESDMGYTFITM